MNAHERPLLLRLLVDALGWLLSALLALLALLCPPFGRWLDAGDRDYTARSGRTE